MASYESSDGRKSVDREQASAVLKRLVVPMLLLLLMLGGASPYRAQAAAPAAGASIVNRASASYIPDGYTQQETISSNTVYATIQAVEALSLTQDQTIVRTPGATARFSHLLTNTGNTSSTYTLTLTAGGAGCPAPDFNLAGIKVYLDLNSNGVIDAGDPPVTLGAPAAIRLASGRTASLLIEGVVPATATSGQACFNLTATADTSGGTASNVDTTQVRNVAVLSLVKSASHPGIVLPGVTTVDFTVNATNIGNQDAMPSTATADGGSIRVDGFPRSLVLIRDAIPQGTQYIAGSLRTAMPGVLRLFRLPGDPAYSYRTAGDDAAAIEVAIGLPSALVRNGSVAMTFTVRVMTSASGQILNTADGHYFDGFDLADGRSNTVVIATTPASIGLAKAAGRPRGNLAADGTPDGTATVTFTLRAKNYGADTLYNVQVHDVLEGGGTAFGAYTASAVPAVGQYTVVAGSLRIAQLRGAGAVASVETAFTGAGSQTALLVPGAQLPAGGEVVIVFDVRFAVAGHPATLYNNATAEAALFATGASAVTDRSVDGADPDPDQDGNPGDNASPTPVPTALPMLSLQKTVTPPRRTGTVGEYEFEYRLTVTNTGTVTAPYVRLIDNLDCSFQMDQASGPIASWQLVGPPIAQNGLLMPAAGFTGSAACDRAAFANPSAYLSLPTAVALSLTDGSRSLAPGASETLVIRVRVVLKPAAIGTRVQIDNRAWAASYDSNIIGGDPGTLVVAVTDDTVGMLLIDPQGVVYNAVTRDPVAGATVRFYRESCPSGASTAITADELYFGQTAGVYTFNADGSVSMVTPASGEYMFFLRSPPVAERCTYRLQVTPPAGSGLVAPSTLIPPESGVFTACGAVVPNSGAPQSADPTTYYLQFEAGRSGSSGAICEVIHNHLPLDPARIGGLMLQKQGDKSLAELGDFVHYTLTLTNGSGSALVGARFVDELPLGFTYVSGSTRVDGAAMPDPAQGQGRTLVFDYPALTIAAGATVTVRYRLRVGVGAPTSGDAINRVRAYSGTLQTNEASWRVRIGGGVFSDEAFVFGKVFLDCNRNREQDPSELGIPGVRLFLEDGTGAVTDSEGKWSLYGLRPITHALKIDATTLPEGAELELLGSRHAGRPDSRFVDLRKGEWHKANFAIDGCENEAVVMEVKARREQLLARPDAEGETVRARVRLAPDGQPVRVGDVRALAASGQISDNGGVQLNVPASRPLIETSGATTNVAAATTSAFKAVTPEQTRVPVMNALPDLGAPAAPTVVPLEQALTGLDNQLAFMDLEDRDTLPSRQINVRVKGPADMSLRLSVGGEAVPERRVGKKASYAAHGLAAWEYIGIELTPGENKLDLEAVDAFGNVRDRRSITVVAPDRLAQLDFDVPANVRVGVPLRFSLRLTDASGVPVTARTAVTLEANAGRWITSDLNPDEPGLQVFIEGGRGEFELMPPDAPGDGFIRASAGTTLREARVAFLPELRPLTGIGIAEVRLDFGKRAGGLGVRDAFEAELQSWSEDFSGGKGHGSSRLALFFKGVIKGEYLLTAAYDSDKASRDRLFRDIRPDEYYPVYGDASTRVFDAQTTDRAYVRIDKNRSFLMYGDLTTAASPEVRQLSQVNRSLTGVKQHYESDRVRVEAYAAHDSLRQKIEEFTANGTSGPFYLKGTGDLFANSERVEVLVRDRNQPNLILSIRALTRFADYAIEPLSKRLLLSGPISSLDPDLNPQSIRITYEVDSGGPAFWVAGADAQVKVNENVQLGVAASVDDNPDNARKLVAATGIARLGEKTTLAAELVGTRTDAKGDGYGARVELRHDGEKLKAQAQVAKVDANFDNPSSAVAPGRTEANARIDYTLTERTRLRGELVYSDGQDGENKRQGAAVSVQHRFTPGVTAEVGVRAGHETVSPAGSFDYGTVSSPSTSASSNNPGGTSENDLLTVRGRITAQLPSAPQARVFVEAEQALDASDRRVLAAGGDYRINDKLRLYGRHEFISSLTGPYGLNASQRNNVDVFGIESTFMKTGRAYSEYRLRDSIDGRSAQAALGLRNQFRLRDGLTLQAGLEHTDALGGKSGMDSTALTTSLEYVALDWLKASGGLEMRFGDDADTILGTAGVAWKINPDWTLLARTAINDTQSKGTDATDRLLARQQIGVAYRPTDQDIWNALARYEYKLDRQSGRTDEETATHILSAHLNVQPNAQLQINGRFAAKYSVLDMDGLRSTYWAQMLSARAIYDLGERWDVGMQTAFLLDKRGTMQWALGVEGGYRLMPNLWLSLGYNVLGLNDSDFADEDYLDQGAYVRLRYKFDESLFGGGRSARPVPAHAPVPAATPPAPAAVAPVPMPEPPAAQPPTDPMAGTVHFRFNGDAYEDMAPDALDELARIATTWKRLPAPKALVLAIGYADRLGANDYNLRLSARRAATVRDILVRMGVPEERIRIEARGIAEPVAQGCTADNATAENIDCLAADRRVEILIERGDAESPAH